MNLKSAIFGLICVKPHTINSILKRLPYSPDSIYNAIEEMLKREEIVKIKTNGETRLDIPKHYNYQKLKEIFIKSLSYGVDPEILLRKNTLAIWDALDTADDVKNLTKKTRLSEKTVRKILKFLADSGLVKFKKRKPLIAEKVNDHLFVRLLNSIIKETNTNEGIYIPGATPFEEIITTPDEIEKILYEKIDNNLTIKRTGFTVRGKRDKIAVLESVETKQTFEEIFINKLMTPEGVEDTCIKILANNKIDYERLLKLAIKKNLVNQVGCYLDIIYNINRRMIPPKIIKKFHNNISNKKSVFLKDDMKFGKSGWEIKYEKKWNIDLYLDIGGIKHGVRGL